MLSLNLFTNKKEEEKIVLTNHSWLVLYFFSQIFEYVNRAGTDFNKLFIQIKELFCMIKLDLEIL